MRILVTRKNLKFLACVLFALLYLGLMFAIIDMGVSEDQERWEAQTSGLPSPRPSAGD